MRNAILGNDLNYGKHSLRFQGPYLWSKLDNRECKHDVHGRRQTVKMNSDFVFIPTNP